jgi:8-oxo-dGTP pyrophosphatase MutT (NUDIX family)
VTGPPSPERTHLGLGSGSTPTDLHSGAAESSEPTPSRRNGTVDASWISGAVGPLVVDARRVLTGWAAPSSDQDALRRRYLSFLDEHPDADSRDLRAGHLTASTVVLDASRERVLLTLHPLANRWFQLGGHVESGDGTIAAAALREATEESGIEGLDLHPTPLGLDWHPVRCRNSAGVPAPSSHLDFEYVALAPPGAEHLRSAESLDLAWFAHDALPEGADDVVRALIQRVRDLGLA